MKLKLIILDKLVQSFYYTEQKKTFQISIYAPLCTRGIFINPFYTIFNQKQPFCQNWQHFSGKTQNANFTFSYLILLLYTKQKTISKKCVPLTELNQDNYPAKQGNSKSKFYTYYFNHLLHKAKNH
jgi:hypothetical protein